MSKTINLRKKKYGGIKIVATIFGAIILSVVGIKAGDNFMSKKNGANEVGSVCPLEMVPVSSPLGGFCVDKYEATPSVDCPAQNPQSQDETRLNLDYASCKAETKKGAIPWRNISQDQAAVACAKAGKRLATNEEWLQASLGTPDSGTVWGLDDCQVDSNWPDQPGNTGSGIKCVSGAGAYDMIGNVWEWVKGAVMDGVMETKVLPEQGFVDSLDGASFPGKTNPDVANENYNKDFFWIKAKGLRGIVRGGYWSNKTDAGQYAVYIVAPPESAENGIGFRCVK